MNDIEKFIETIPLAQGCEIAAYDPCGLIAISKKAGKASHPNPDGERGNPMIKARYNFDEEYYSWIDENDEKQRLWLVNRLDSPTSGIVITCADAEVAEAAKEAFRTHDVKKIYRAICVCRAPARSGVWKETLFEQKFAGFVRNAAARREASKPRKAEAKFTVENFDKNNLGLCQIKLEPLTGLTHQLRVQCAKHFMPILGDATYGNFAANKKIRAISKINRLFLHCSETSLKLDVGGKQIEFSAEAPLPESFTLVMQRPRF